MSGVRRKIFKAPGTALQLNSHVSIKVVGWFEVRRTRQYERIYWLIFEGCSKLGFGN